jgi:heterodisulfide reductase subunit A
MDWEKETVEVNEVLCQGCGACAAVCPNSAAVLRGFPDEQVMAEIDAALGVVG